MPGGTTRRGFIRLLAVGSVTLAAACSPAPTAVVTQQAAAPTSVPPTTAAAPAATTAPVVASAPVTAGWVAVNGSMSPIWIAQDAGLFDKYGVKADVQFIQGSVNGTAALVSGSVQVLQTAAIAIVNSVKQGGPAAMFAGFVDTSFDLRLMADPSVTSIEGLRGKTIAVSTVGGAPDLVLRKILKDHGLTPGQDVTIIGSGDPNGQLGALQAKQVQAIALTIPDDARAKAIGAVSILDPSTLTFPYQAVGLASTRAYLRDSRQAALAFLQAESEAIHRFKTDRAFAEATMSKYIKTTDTAVLESTWQAYTPAFLDIPAPSAAGIQEILDEQGDTRGKTPADCMDASLVQELVDRGFYKSLLA